ncbi:hypothetical protein [Metabacillus bambusae]|uniref:Uncharacterized protein n=1 Tax=Metabacillus bambusae TaxID=2795218 RepID=A0ABS3NAH6_9BACI|nr:hypothetical protein [Metabacillus bambusae]MBO1515050.1 hypothetical protein [Metabacillus bambusae]
MPTIETIDLWIQSNVLDTKAWDESTKQSIAVTQASRNINRWYPDIELTDEIVSYQVIWELQALDPVLKYQKQGLKHISESGERIEYNIRDVVAPEVREILGSPLFEQDEEVAFVLEGGTLL